MVSSDLTFLLLILLLLLLFLGAFCLGIFLFQSIFRWGKQFVNCGPFFWLALVFSMQLLQGNRCQTIPWTENAIDFKVLSLNN